MSHKCPSYKCDTIIMNDNILMCRTHWSELPKGEQQKIYDSLDKNGIGSKHMAVIQEVVAAQKIRMNRGDW